MIIKEADVVITHFGVLGMRWGVRKDRYAQNREKAKNIINQNLKERDVNIFDVKAAKWMSKSVPNKISGEFFKNAMNVTATALVAKGPDAFKDPKEVSKLIASIAKKTATTSVLKEITSTSALKRYEQSGAKDKSKRQYKKVLLTPEQAIVTGINVARAAAPIISFYGGIKVHELVYNKRQEQAAVDARMRKWGANLLDKKTSEFHTIYDDGYMSVLERIKKG